MALEQTVAIGDTVVDVGAGSAMLMIGALHLGAARATGVDVDCTVFDIARVNLALNHLQANLVCGSADCMVSACADVTVANISGSVLLSIWDDLLRITRPGGTLIVTGFPEAEADYMAGLLDQAQRLESEEWVCLVARLS
jgi:ribosomal protein L11 methyltransferase